MNVKRGTTAAGVGIMCFQKKVVNNLDCSVTEKHEQYW